MAVRLAPRRPRPSAGALLDARPASGEGEEIERKPMTRRAVTEEAILANLGRLFVYSRRMVLGNELGIVGDDVVQDAIEIMLRRGNFDQSRRFMPWAATILKRAYFSQRRELLARLRRERNAPQRHAIQMPEASWDWRENVDGRLMRHLARLSHDQQSAIELRYVFELTPSQIATRLGITPAAAKMLLAYGLFNLRKMASGYDGKIRVIGQTRPKRYGPTCDFHGCGRPRYRQRYCPGHRKQLERSGKLTPLQLRAPRRYV